MANLVLIRRLVRPQVDNQIGASSGTREFAREHVIGGCTVAGCALAGGIGDSGKVTEGGLECEVDVLRGVGEVRDAVGSWGADGLAGGKEVGGGGEEESGEGEGGEDLGKHCYGVREGGLER